MGNLCKKKQSDEVDVEKKKNEDENNNEDGKTKLTVEDSNKNNHLNENKINENCNDIPDDSSQVEMKLETKKENFNELTEKSKIKKEKVRSVDEKSVKTEKMETKFSDKNNLKIPKVNESNLIEINEDENTNNEKDTGLNHNILADGCILIDDNNELIKKNDKELKEKMEVVEFKNANQDGDNLNNKDLIDNISHLIANQNHNLDQQLNNDNINNNNNINNDNNNNDGNLLNEKNVRNNPAKVNETEDADVYNNIYDNLNFTQDQNNNDNNVNNLDETNQSLAQESVYSIKNNLRIVDENALKEKDDMEKDKVNLKSFYEKLKVNYK